MEQDLLTLKKLIDRNQIVIDYSDEDLIIIDNVTELAKPDSARMLMNAVAVCSQGIIQARMNGKPLRLVKNQLLLCPPNVVLSDFMVSPEFAFKAIFFTNRLLQNFLREKMSVWNEVMYIHRMHVVTMQEEDIEFLTHFYSMLRLCLDKTEGHPYSTDVIQSLLRGAFLGLCGKLKTMLPGGESHAQLSDSLFQRFLDLLNHSEIKHRTVESFAQQLYVSPKYLSTVCKKASGKTANQWITEHLLEEIRYFLVQTELPFKQVAARLGFANASFFGKYVKAHFGMTPMQLRHHNP